MTVMMMDISSPPDCPRSPVCGMSYRRATSTLRSWLHSVRSFAPSISFRSPLPHDHATSFPCPRSNSHSRRLPYRPAWVRKRAHVPIDSQRQLLTVLECGITSLIYHCAGSYRSRENSLILHQDSLRSLLRIHAAYSMRLHHLRMIAATCRSTTFLYAGPPPHPHVHQPCSHIDSHVSNADSQFTSTGTTERLRQSIVNVKCAACRDDCRQGRRLP